MTTTHTPPPPPAPPVEEQSGPMSGSQLVRAALVVGLIVLLAAKLGIWALVILLGLLVSITLHEFGHFIAAKKAGMKVTEFFLGFGPKIWSVRKGETEYGLKLVPAGAYVRIIGMHNLEEVDPADEARTYRQAGFKDRFCTVVAGVAMNAAIAVVLIWVLLAVVGVTGGRVLPGEPAFGAVSQVLDNSPAARAGIKAGDRILRVDGVPIDDFKTLRSTLDPNMGKEVDVTVLRKGEEMTLAATPGQYTYEGESGCGLGVTAGRVQRSTERTNPVVAVPQSFVELGRVTGLTVQGLGRFFSPSGLSDYGDQVLNASDEEAPVKCAAAPAGQPAKGSGSASAADEPPNRILSLVGLFQIGTDAPNSEMILFLFMTLNITLVVVNLIPLLPFDGGHIAIAVYEKIQERRRRMTARYFTDVNKLLPITYGVVLLLFLLFVSSIYLDLASPITE